jgi:hypothetical protein
MRSFVKKPRAMHKNELLRELETLQDDISAIEKFNLGKVKSLQFDTKSFFEQIFGFTPYRYQLELADLSEKNQFTAVR